MYLDGSFVSGKGDPADFDGCWDLDGVDLELLDAVLKTFDDGRRAQKEKYGGELFPAEWDLCKSLSPIQNPLSWLILALSQYANDNGQTDETLRLARYE